METRFTVVCVTIMFLGNSATFIVKICYHESLDAVAVLAGISAVCSFAYLFYAALKASVR